MESSFHYQFFLFHTTSTTKTSGKQKNTKDNGQIHVITIGHQYGSGGHDIGFELTKRLGYTFYDKDIIKMIAGTTGYSTQYIEKKEEKTKRICQREHLSEKDAKKKLLKEEKLRSSNYHYYTHRI